MSIVDIQADKAIRLLQRVGSSVRPSDLLGVIGDRLLHWANQNFTQAGTEIPWAPLRPNTVAGRRKGSSAPLQDTGRLRQSVSKKVLGSAVQIGYGVNIAGFHHFGTSPYTIRPKSAKALRFQTTEGVTFSRIVRHPGLPRRRLLPSDTLTGKLATAEVDAVLEQATRSAG